MLYPFLWVGQLAICIGDNMSLPNGRPTKYKPEYDEQAYKLCLLGHTDKELASFFEVSEQTINAWKHQYPSFLESLKRGKDVADGEVSQALYKSALGYSHPDVDIKVVNGAIVETDLIKHYPPNPTSAIFWLKNRQSGKWRDKQEVATTSDDKPTTINLVMPNDDS